MTSTRTSSVQSKTAPASCKRRTTCHLVNASTLPWIMLGTGGPSHNTSPMLRRKNGERRHPAVTEQAAQQLVGRERRERISHLALCGAGGVDSRPRVNSTVRPHDCCNVSVRLYRNVA